MTIDAAEPQPPSAETAATTNTFQRIAGVLFAPASTFQDIARKPDFILPMVIFILLGFASTMVLMPKMDFETSMRTQMEQSGRKMSPEDIDRAVKMGKAFGKVMAYVGPFITIAMYLIIAGVLLLGVRLFGGDGTFPQALSTTLYAWVPLTIYYLLVAIVGMTRTSIDPTQMPTLLKSNLAFLVEMKEHPVLFSFLSSIDVFTIWTLVLLIIGFAVLSRLSRARTAGIVIFLWLATILVKVGFAALGAARMKS